MKSDEKMDAIWRMSDVVYSPTLDTPDQVREFITCLTKLIYDYKMVGLVYDFYPEEVEYHKQSGIRYSHPDEIAIQINELEAAFPDLHTEIDHIIVYRAAPDCWKVFRRMRLKGTNLGFSPNGPATGKPLGERCLNLSMLYLKQVDGAWKIPFEVNSDSESLLRQVQTGGAEGGTRA